MASHATGDGGIPPRDAAKRGLKRIMSLGGAYGTRNHTVKNLRDHKGKRVLVETLPFSPEEAAAAEEAGIDTMKVRFDPNQPAPAAAIRQAAPNTFMAFSVPLLAAASETEAVRLAYDAMAIGADAIMCQWSPRFIAAAAEADPAFIHLKAFNLPPQEKKLVISTEGIVQLGEFIARDISTTNKGLPLIT